MFLVLQLGKDGHKDLVNMDPSYCALGVSEGSPHICLYGPNTRQHLVDRTTWKRWRRP